MSKYIGDVSAYAYAVSKGYAGTEEEFAELMADYAEVGQRAEDAADRAEAALNEFTSVTADATTLPEGSSATAEYSNGHLAFGIPKGDKGDGAYHVELSGESFVIHTDASGVAAAQEFMIFIDARQGTTKKVISRVDGLPSISTGSGTITPEIITHAFTGSVSTIIYTIPANTQISAGQINAQFMAYINDGTPNGFGVRCSLSVAVVKDGAKGDKGDTGEVSQAEFDEVAGDVSELKNTLTTLESDGAVPSSDQILTDKGVTDSVPYHYRKTGGDGADREYVDAIVGGTVNWNQLAKPVTSDYWSAESNVSVSFADSVATFTSQTANNGIKSNAQKQVAASHVYYMGFSFQSGSASAITCLYGGNGGARVSFTSETSMTGVYKIAKADASASGSIIYLFPASSGVNVEHKVKNVMLIDLTQMFGTTIADYVNGLETATAGAGVEWLKSHFPRIFNAGYIPYNAGELVSVQASAHKMVGFNQWDEEWEYGLLAVSTGQPVTGSGIRSKNFSECLPNTTYHMHTGGSSTAYIFWYDSNKNYISNRAENRTDFNATSPTNACYFKIRKDTTATYNHDICINISSSRNGEYEPYKAHSYPLDDSLELRGLPKLDADNNLVYDGDVYESTGKVTRKYGIVDLGTLNWQYSATGTGHERFIYAHSKLLKGGTCLCNRLQAVAYTDVYNHTIDNSIAIHPNAQQIEAYASAYADVTAFRTAMSGVMLVYELATPTTEEADPYQRLQQCDPNGTEEYVSTGIVPIGHNSFYPENLRAKVEQLPWNFASLIAPTESTFTATRNYTTGSLFIVNNILYKATANIANGGTITPNTNCTATTLAEIISALA